jgi:hypothetical protein
MSQEHAPDPARQASTRRPYLTPTLTVFGEVASMTGTQSMTGTNMDGGPNNSKT